MQNVDKYLEIKDHTGEGYARVVEFESWTAAAINYGPGFDRAQITGVSRHNETDETFVLTEGAAILAVGELEGLVCVPLEKNKFYNVKKGVWHALFASKDARVIVAENSNTGAANSDRSETFAFSDSTALPDEKYLEIREHNGEGYARVIEFEGWTAALINYCDRFTKESFTRVERHNATDETFILTEGSAQLIVGEPESPVFVEMEKNKFYNVRKGAWHHIIVSKDARVVIVENSDTGMANSDYCEV